MEEKKDYVTYGDKSGCGCGCGCEGDHAITGCRFSLSPMCDNFIPVILGAVEKVDTSKVWSRTDRLSTIYRGKRVHVLDAVKACFVYAYREDVHMTMETTISKGCPGDVEADCFMAEDDSLLNEEAMKDIHFQTTCKFSLYPMGVPDYMRYIAAVVNRSIDRNIYVESTHYVTVLQGDVQELFAFFNEAAAYCEQELSHYIMEVTFMVNSPTK